MIVGVFSGENIVAFIMGVVFVALGIALLRWRKPLIRAMTRAQLRLGTPGARVDQKPWAAVMVGVIWIAIGTLALLAGLSNGYGTWD